MIKVPATGMLVKLGPLAWKGKRSGKLDGRGKKK
jgi:hypothetical protein